MLKNKISLLIKKGVDMDIKLKKYIYVIKFVFTPNN